MAENAIFTAVFEMIGFLYEITVAAILRKMGYPESTIKKLSNMFAWLIVAILILLLIIFTIKFS